MSRVVKLIWRLDFKPSYAYIDNRGTALNLLSNTVKDFWATVGDGMQHMSFVARTDNEKAFRTMSIEPTNINGSIEWADTIELKQALQTDEFKSVDKIAKEMLKLFEIKSVVRAGVRCLCVASFADGKRNRHVRMMQHIDKASSAVVESKLGPIPATTRSGFSPSISSTRASPCIFRPSPSGRSSASSPGRRLKPAHRQRNGKCSSAKVAKTFAD